MPTDRRFHSTPPGARRALTWVAAAATAVLLTATGWAGLDETAAHAAVGATADGLEFTTAAGEATITGYTGTGREVAIPAEVSVEGTTYPVTAIGYRAFSDAGLTAATLPEGLVTITAGAFEKNALTEIALPEDLVKIGNNAFEANRLTMVELPDSLTELGTLAFGNNALTSVHLSAGLTAVPARSFEGNEIASLTLPASITSIGDYAFAFNALTELTLPQTVTAIGVNAFFENSLTSLTLPDSLTEIPPYAFWSNNLRTVTIPASIDSIGGGGLGGNPLGSIVMLGDAPALGADQTDAALPSRTGTIYVVPGATGFDGPDWEPFTIEVLELTVGTADAPAPGEDATVSGTWNLPGAEVSIELDGETLGTATVTDAGTFSLTATIPAGAEPGDHPLTASTSIAGYVARADALIEVVEVGEPGEDGAGGTDSDGDDADGGEEPGTDETGAADSSGSADASGDADPSGASERPAAGEDDPSSPQSAAHDPREPLAETGPGGLLPGMALTVALIAAGVALWRRTGPRVHPTI